MRTIRGTIELPPDAPACACVRVVVEVRDVTMQDAPSTVVAQQELRDVALTPGGRIPFEVEVPDAEPGRSLSVRVHGSVDGSGQVKAGDLLTTASCPIAASGGQGPLQVVVKVI